jgi:hypothetical protein
MATPYWLVEYVHDDGQGLQRKLHENKPGDVVKFSTQACALGAGHELTRDRVALYFRVILQYHPDKHWGPA